MIYTSILLAWCGLAFGKVFLWLQKVARLRPTSPKLFKVTIISLSQTSKHTKKLMNAD